MGKHESWEQPEFLNFREISFNAGLGAIAAGTHEGTVIRSYLFVAAVRPGEIVNPNAVHLGALVQMHGIVNPMASGEHFTDAGALNDWASHNRVERTFITDSYNASQLPPRNIS